MINKNDLRKAISSIAISNAKRNTIYKAFSDLDSITKEEFDSVKSDISKVVESMLTKDTVGKANGVASLDSNGSVPIEQLSNIDTTLFLIVRELPTTDIKTNKIYLVPNQDGQGNNVYVEYLYVENVWEKIGEFKAEVDITDIKTKSIYPAGTGSSSLKDPSLGAIEGNYIVSNGSLGKPAHNYDKLFVENIYWSDCTDIENEETSLNGDGLVPIYERQGVSGAPTFYLKKAVNADIRQSSFLYYDEQIGSFCFQSQSEDSNEGYNIDSYFCFNTDGTISSQGIDGVRGNGVWYNDYSEDNNIPFEYIKNLYDDEGTGYMSIKNINTLSFNFDYIHLSAYLYQDIIKGYKGCLSIESFDTRYEHTNIPKYVCIQAKKQILYIESKNGTSTSVFATDGSHFDLNKKADIVNGKLKTEQLPKLVNITTASTAEEVVTKFNALLADLKAKGYMEADTAQ